MQDETQNPDADAAQEPNNALDPWGGGTPPPGTAEQEGLLPVEEPNEPSATEQVEQLDAKAAPIEGGGLRV